MGQSETESRFGLPWIETKSQAAVWAEFPSPGLVSDKPARPATGASFGRVCHGSWSVDPAFGGPAYFIVARIFCAFLICLVRTATW